MKGYSLTILLIVATAHAGYASEKETQAQTPVNTPFKNYWDANSWEANSSATFWRAGSPTPQSASQDLAGRKSNPASSPATVSTSSRTETNRVLHRQSEK